jgi:HK97 family phage major capsid protein
LPSLLEELRARRVELRQSTDEILTRAATEGRDLEPAEWTQYRAHQGDLQQVQDRIEELRDQELAELRARVPAGRGPTLTRADAELARRFRSAIYSKNPAPIEVYSDLPDEWPDDLPEVQGRVGRVQVHTRDTLKSTATQAMGVDVYSRIVQHMVETSSLMAAGATVVTTATGEDLVIPKSTGFVSSAIIGEGASITESDPTLSTVTLKAFKYANFSKFRTNWRMTRQRTFWTSWPARPPCPSDSGRPATATTSSTAPGRPSRAACCWTPRRA